MTLSVVIPTLNAAPNLPRTLAALGALPDEIIVCDGGSTDGTPALAASLGTRVVFSPRGRGLQLAAGVAHAREKWLLLLHADTRLDPDWTEAARKFMRGPEGRAAFFRFALDSADPRARALERRVAWRCRVLGLPYGDQGLLIARALLESVGGVAPLVLMEDVDLVRRIGRRRLVGLDVAAVTSAKKFERDGWRLRSARNLCCLALYFAGVPPHLIARLYS